jgi:hypothetical protein
MRVMALLKLKGFVCAFGKPCNVSSIPADFNSEHGVQKPDAVVACIINHS